MRLDRAGLWLFAPVPSSALGAEPVPIFDADLDCNAEAMMRYPVSAALGIFRRNGIRGILATRRPDDGTAAKPRRAPAAVRSRLENRAWRLS